MEQTTIRVLRGLVVAVAFLLLLPSVGEAVTKQRTCGSQPGQTIEQFLDELNSGDTLLVNGTCNENVVVGTGRTGITLDGQGTATIIGPDTTEATVTITGRNITLKGFTINGGRDGVRVTRGGTATITGNTITGAAGTRDGIIVNRGGEATIDGNTIGSWGRFGINLDQNGTARIVNNTVQNNGSHGILVDESSSGRIGFLAFGDTVAGPNTIQSNGGRGVNVTRSASAVILSNTVSNNTLDGVGVFRGSHADIGANTIDGNGDSGIFVSENSGVNLGQTGIAFDSSNSTTVGSENTDFGLGCSINSYANGTRGSLTGVSGATDFTGGCVDSTSP